ncbi:MAG: HD domain-containing protein [Weizmannia coagulans]|jgi:putative hydrolase of HD superfamily|uniref:Metal dependent phosphohydrolase n=1 Tax=Heyndrickxia coagulans 36D1 TaxID=345219 RepID=G2TQ38_HEYCO|nr:MULTISPECIES: HD domain-containing protein [Heyndrickxia]AEO99686.1 metal dependent phosphohydrolase [Heyndrickxia coagulans 36D1]AWP36308.1 HD domain-containing protein [Heyndrickxia coagulans]MBQ4909770.1 HD domain-containing protein [Heyndrickxia faecalis]MCI1574644.1 HD domain-containing protein [Heyndrickxia coagulans]MED4839836.1 HD domain-containing protein [Weizmannia sp. CD-2023]
MGVHQYFKSLSDLEKIYRCPGKFKFQEHSVAAHSFKVAKIAQFFGHVEEKAGNKVDWRALYQKALNHDYPELFTGDIKTPVKYSSKELHELFKQVEEEMTKNFINGVFPEEYREIYFDLFKEGKDDTLEGKILSVSDKVDLLYESFGEIQKGNPEPLFLEIYEESLRTILRFSGLASVQYFLTSILPDLLAERFIERSQLRGITDEIIENEFKR